MMKEFMSYFFFLCRQYSRLATVGYKTESYWMFLYCTCTDLHISAFSPMCVCVFFSLSHIAIVFWQPYDKRRRIGYTYM